MLAAEAKKAGSASVDTRLTPRPPSLTGYYYYYYYENRTQGKQIKTKKIEKK